MIKFTQACIFINKETPEHADKQIRIMKNAMGMLEDIIKRNND